MGLVGYRSQVAINAEWFDSTFLMVSNRSNRYRAQTYASVAQLVVLLICNQRVVGSSPTASTSSISIDLRR